MTHKNRLKNISQFALPPKGTEAYSRFIENFKQNQNKNLLKKCLKKH